MYTGLEKKCLPSVECKDSMTAHGEILSVFPALKSTGGYELVQVGEKQRIKLEVISLPLQGYTARYLKEIISEVKLHICQATGQADTSLGSLFLICFNDSLLLLTLPWTPTL